MDYFHFIENRPSQANTAWGLVKERQSVDGQKILNGNLQCTQINKKGMYSASIRMEFLCMSGCHLCANDRASESEKVTCLYAYTCRSLCNVIEMFMC